MEVVKVAQEFNYSGQDFEEAFFYLLITRVEPGLASLEQPVFLYNYPPDFSGMARIINAQNPRLIFWRRIFKRIIPFLLKDYTPGPRLYGQGSSLAALVLACPLGRLRPSGLPLTALGPGKKEKLKGGREKEIF
ncbi:MAG: hypothetical protein LWW94_08755, partial [Candidatus Desulfofervidaceae bacterium]|nr:hypothetical protein [Candidatus Desulfofervidaceae bacterium]